MMSYLNSDPADMDVYLSSSAPASVDRGYHKIWGAVKKSAPTVTSWGRGEAYGIVEETICKVAYQFGRSLPSNDLSQPDAKSLRGDMRHILKLSGCRSDYPTRRCF